VQLGKKILSKTGIAGRLIAFGAAAGVLAAALVVPIVAAGGVVIRNQADKFTTLSLSASGLPQRSEILDRYGHLLAYVYGVDMPYYNTASSAQPVQYFGWDRQPVGYNQINANMRNAIVAIEDDRYWQHGAIDLKGTFRALMNDLEHKPVQGGSTIAQQYVKNVLLLTAELQGNTQAAQAAYAENLSRKLNELRMAVAVEHEQTKQQILAGYLNDAYFGHNAYGIEAAAETYFGTTAAQLTVTQAATLAGIVENPSLYDPTLHPETATERRNTVLARMWQTNNGLTQAQAQAAQSQPIGLRVSPAQSGCNATSVGSAGYFCEYVEEVFLHDPAYGATAYARAKLLSTGGLQIYTTLDPQDQHAANSAVNYVVPDHNGNFNPGQNADTEAMVQPGTGEIRAIAEDRPYGTGRGQTEIDYAVNTAYGGSSGVQTGSSSKLFTLVTALEHGIPFSYTQTVPGSETLGGFTNCVGAPAGISQGGVPGAWDVSNAEGPGTSTQTLYTGTTNSINVFYAELEKRVGLCNVVRTANALGMTRADGTSLLSADGSIPSADNFPSFTLGSVYVSPLNMSAAYAAMAARGTYCSPIAIDKIITDTSSSLDVPSANCHQAVPAPVADAVNYILQGVLTSGTAANIGPIAGRQTAGKTGTSNVASGNGTPYAAFAGYIPSLVGYVSVFYPEAPTAPAHVMGGTNACYRLESGVQNCGGGEMFGADAPASTWHMSFDHADLGPVTGFVSVPGNSPFNSGGNGQTVKQPKKKDNNNNNGNGNNNFPPIVPITTGPNGTGNPGPGPFARAGGHRTRAQTALRPPAGGAAAPPAGGVTVPRRAAGTGAVGAGTGHAATSAGAPARPPAKRHG
jgi:membrane peptidoglycan carboxypeptidase